MKNKKKLKENLTAWALLSPAILFMLVFTVYPIIKSVRLSFSKYTLGMSEPVFIGLKNYIDLAKSPLFWKIMGNTLYFSLITIIPSLVIGLLLALLVNRKHKKVGFLRTVFFYPVVMPMIAVASIWFFIYMGKNGLFDQLVMKFGFEPMNVLSNRKTVLPFMAIMYVWKEVGFIMVFYLAGLQNISGELYEAALIDGASPWKILKYITIPLLKPTTIFISTVALTNSFKLVDHIVIMTEGAPNNASTLLLYYIYQQSFINFNYGKAGALTVIMLVLLLIVSLPRFFKQDKNTHYNS